MQSDKKKLKMWKKASREEKESYWAILDNVHQEQLIYDYNEKNDLNYCPSIEVMTLRKSEASEEASSKELLDVPLSIKEKSSRAASIIADRQRNNSVKRGSKMFSSAFESSRIMSYVSKGKLSLK